jgi:hypothetical protein
MIETIETGLPNVVGLKLSGKLHDEDYRQFVPGWEIISTVEGKLRLFIQFEDFHSWDLHSAWDDLSFGLKRDLGFERIAIVGDRKWEKLVASFAKPFIQAEVKYFDESEVGAAWKWLRENGDGEEATEGIGELAEVSSDPDLWSHVPWY